MCTVGIGDDAAHVAPLDEHPDGRDAGSGFTGDVHAAAADNHMGDLRQRQAVTAVTNGQSHVRLTLDLPASARVGRRIVEDEGFAQRVAFREGDALRESLGEEQDVLSMFNLLHHLRPEAVAELLARAHAALRPGGHLVIGETEPGTPGQTPEVIGAASALVYFVSSGTRNYTRLEIAGWLERAGFEAIEVRHSQAAPWRLIYLARATGPRAG